MTDIPTKQLTLTDVNLLSSERALLETIMRLTSAPQLRLWQWLPKDAPTSTAVDLLLVDGRNPADEASLRRAKKVLFIGTPRDFPDQDYSVLGRPIRAEQFLAWMTENTPGHAAQTPQAAPSVSPQASSRAADVPVHIIVKLRRWPSNDVLRKDSGRVRMASLLTRRAMSAMHLSVLSGQHLSACKDFIQDLSRMNLLLLASSASQTAGSAPLQPIAVTSAAQAPTMAAASPREGFFASLRHRLGL